jgi:RNA polymerase sigma-70 factor (ECF subfamily)
MLGSGSEAEDAVQEAMIKAHRAAEGFEGRSSIRSWLYRIATNVCIDMLRSSQRRARPMELGPSSAPEESLLWPTLSTEKNWISPIADERVLPDNADPAEIVNARESIRLAFITALQHLPPRQRAALILCDVLRWHASEAAELLDTTVAAVNSALQRARATLSDLPQDSGETVIEGQQAELLERYVNAFERYDIERLVKLLHEDAVMSMPPFAMWIQGAENIGRFMLEPSPSQCRGSRLLPVRANGSPAFAQYKPDPAGGWSPWALQVLEISAGRIAGYHSFLDTERIFPTFGLPPHLPAESS